MYLLCSDFQVVFSYFAVHMEYAMALISCLVLKEGNAPHLKRNLAWLGGMKDVDTYSGIPCCTGAPI